LVFKRSVAPLGGKSGRVFVPELMIGH